MKKIFRMALVFALAGATLMYTGCTKDYSEDINKLDSELSALENDLAGVKAELGNLQSAVNALESAYKAADKELEGKFNDKIAAIQDALDKKADKKWAEDEMAKLKEELLAKAKELEETAEALKEEVQSKLDEFYSIISGELRNLFFLPDFYYAGVEATEYGYANFTAYEMTCDKDNTTTSTVNPKVVYAKGAKLGSSKQAQIKNKFNQLEDYNYLEGSVGIAKYDMNPSNFPVDSAKWSMKGMDLDYIALKDEEETWYNPTVVSVEGVDGVAEVGFKIENYDLIKYVDDATSKNIVPVIQATATLAGEKNISSDWAAILLGEDILKDLAFTEESDWTTTYTHQGCPLNTPDQKDLYASAEAALTPEASVKVVYNGGAYNLADDIAIHWQTPASAREEISLAEFAKMYPGFKFNFSLVDYTIGDNKTTEGAYCDLTEDGIFTPCWVNEKGESQKIAADSTSTTGISAVGREPMVLVTLVEPAHGFVVNWGYFKVQISQSAPKLDIKPIKVMDFGKLPYLCSTTKDMKWYEFSAKVLEQLKVNYKQYIETYKLETAATTKDAIQTQALTTPGEYEAQIYVKNGDKFEIAYEINSQTGKPTNTELNLGTITYKVDENTEGVNDKITWTFDNAAAKNIDKYQAVYVILQINSYEKVAFEFKADIAEPAEITYGKINPSYWFEDVEAGVQNTVRANVLVPQKTGNDVKNFSKVLDDYFEGNVLKVQLAEGADDVYIPYFDGDNQKTVADFTATWTYKFAAEQPVINKKQFVASEDGTKLYVAEYNNKGEIVTEKNAKGVDVPKLLDKNLIAEFITVTVDGKEKQAVKYYYSDDENSKNAKAFLNLWGKEETDPAKMLYANVQVDFSASDNGECEAAKGSDVFHLRFIRPIDINPLATDGLADAIPGGDAIFLGNLINATDWNDNEPDPIFKWHAASTDPKETDQTELNDFFYADTYKTVTGNEIVWFTYYGFSQVKIDATKVQTNQTGEWKKLADVNAAAKVYLAKIENKEFVPVTDGVAALGETVKTKNGKYDKIASLMDYLLVYENNGAPVKNFDLKVPVTLSYYWGELTTDVVIPVRETYKETETPAE